MDETFRTEGPVMKSKHPEVNVATTIRVGNTYQEEVMVETVRTPEQHAAVQKIMAQPDFDFACGNPFTEEVGDYTGPFTFTYYTKDERLRWVRIGKWGAFSSEYSGDEHSEQIPTTLTIDERIAQIEIGITTPSTSISRVMLDGLNTSGRGSLWCLTVGDLHFTKTFYYGNTIEECISRCENQQKAALAHELAQENSK
jgi:hypothetical protein